MAGLKSKSEPNAMPKRPQSDPSVTSEHILLVKAPKHTDIADRTLRRHRAQVTGCDLVWYGLAWLGWAGRYVGLVGTYVGGGVGGWVGRGWVVRYVGGGAVEHNPQHNIGRYVTLYVVLLWHNAGWLRCWCGLHFGCCVFFGHL